MDRDSRSPTGTGPQEHAARAVLSLLSRRSHDCVVVLGEGDELTHINDGAQAMLALGNQVVTWAHVHDAIHPEDRPRFISAITRCRYEGREHRGIRVRLITAGGRDLQLACDLINLVGDPGVHGVVLRMRDLAQPPPGRGSAHNVADRAALVGRADAELERCAQEPQRRFALLLITIDRWDEVASALGAAAAKAITDKVSERVYRAASRHGFVGRVDRDRFGVLIAPLGASEAADGLAQELRARVQEPVSVAGVHDLTLTASVGIAFGPRRYASGDDAVRAAETAVNDARRRGGGASVTFDTGMHQRVVDRFWIEHDLRRAESAGELSLCFQPIVRLADGSLTGFEALIRWDHRVRGSVSPADFIPVAEETGLIGPIGAWVVAESCRQLGAWQTQYAGLEGLVVNVNLSAAQLGQSDLLDVLGRALETYGLQPHQLKLEITETAIIADPTAAGVVLHSLKALGVRLALDDFGTGYSSLSYLHSFPFDTLKIDQRFIGDLGVGRDAALVRTIIKLGEAMGMDVVAEGIETEAQRDALRAMGCDYGQGFLFSRPVPADGAVRLLTAIAAR